MQMFVCFADDGFVVVSVVHEVAVADEMFILEDFGVFLSVILKVEVRVMCGGMDLG